MYDQLFSLRARPALGPDRLLAAFFEASEAAAIAVDFGGDIGAWSPGAARLFGYEPDEILGKSILTLSSADKRAEFAGLLDIVREGRAVSAYETIAQGKDGGARDVSIAAAPVRDEHGAVHGSAIILRDIAARKKAEAEQNRRARELTHRTKNALASVVAIAEQTLRKSDPGEVATLAERLRALARSHDALAVGNWRAATIRVVAEGATAAFAADDGRRFLINGPELWLNPQKATTLAMALHELTDNAAKYGALSKPAGRVSISWMRADAKGAPAMRLSWREEDGPPVAPPSRRGFGSVLIEDMVKAEGGEARLEFAREGVFCTLDMPLDAAFEGPASSQESA